MTLKLIELDLSNGRPRFDKFFVVFSEMPQEECPVCGGTQLLADHWPPNYGGGYSYADYKEFSGTTKAICEECKIHFNISYRHIVKRGEVVTAALSYSKPVSLVLREDGYYMTPWDVEREEYKKEHGEYPEGIRYG